MSEPDPRTGHRARWTAVSVALFVLGLAILIPSGLCTAYVGVFALLPAVADGDFSILLAVSIVAGPAIAIGASLVYAGLNARRFD